MIAGMDTQQTVLIVDDDVPLTQAMAKMLTDVGLHPHVAHTAEDGIRLALMHQPNLVLLDVMIPTMGGWEACRQLRQASDVPIIFLTALGNVENVVHGLQLGADDYLVKPVEKAEFVARVQAHLRRLQKLTAQPSQNENELVYGNGDLRIDFIARKAIVVGEEVSLTPREFDLLSVLATNQGRVIPTQELVNQAWGMTDEAASDNIKPYIHYLRKKIEHDPASPRWILTVRGVGYRFANDP